MLRVLVRTGSEACRAVSTSTAVLSVHPVVKSEDLSAKEIWDRRSKLRVPKLQKDEQLSSKVYFAPEWDLEKKPNLDEGFVNPLKGYGMTPEKWEYYNKVNSWMEKEKNLKRSKIFDFSMIFRIIKNTLSNFVYFEEENTRKKQKI